MPIRILDAATVGRIAAGEVVERPSSVVKELVENSLDAGATSVTVEIRGGGIDYLRVTDNGCGIEAQQIRLAFENHATSKIQNADQLNDIRTLGFRGEALPSIASVSHVEMTSRPRNRDAGAKITIDGGENVRVSEVGSPEGTTFIMRDLFYNLPVRRAFLKKPAYEGGLVSDAVARMMIGNPNISMRLINNGNTVYHSFGDGKMRHAIFAVYGKETAEKMIEMDAFEGGTRVWGLIGVGELAKSTRAHQMFFINGRSVRCPLLSKILEQVCRSRVTIGMYPMCALNLTLPPNAIDVNVHPNKLEVRFRDEIMTQVVVEKLLSSAFAGEKVLEFDRDAAPVKEIQKKTVVREITPEEMKRSIEAHLAAKKQPAKTQMPPLPNPGDRGTDSERFHEPDQARTFMQSVKKEQEQLATQSMHRETVLRENPLPIQKPESELQAQKAVHVVQEAQQSCEVSEQVPVPKPTESIQKSEPPKMPALPKQEELVGEQQTMAQMVPQADAKPNYRVIGVVFRTYILIEVDETLLLIDQHAAHERLRYEMYMKRLEAGSASQQLLTPLVVRLSAREMALIMDNLDVLNDAGYTVEPFGEQDIQVRAVPYVLGKAELKPLFMDMINSLNRLKTATVDARRAEIMQMACKSAVKGGDALTESEIDALLREMLATGAPPTCPHGRPVVKAISKREMEKMFKRIQ